MEIYFRGYFLFIVMIVVPILTFVIVSWLSITEYWSRVCFIWLGIQTIIGIMQCLSRLFKSDIRKKFPHTRISIRQIKQSLSDTSLLSEPLDEQKDLGKSQILSNETIVGKLIDLETLPSSKAIKAEAKPLLSGNEERSPLPGIEGRVYPSDVESKMPDENKTLEEKMSPGRMSASEKNPIEDIKLMILNSGHSFWMRKYTLGNIIGRIFITDMWVEYIKCDLRHFRFSHWVYILHMIQGVLSSLGGCFLFATVPYLRVYSLFPWSLLLFSVFELLITATYFITLLWSGNFLSGKYCLYWVPIFLMLIFNLVLFEYSIYLLNYV